jgi:hypothetical protein
MPICKDTVILSNRIVINIKMCRWNDIFKIFVENTNILMLFLGETPAENVWFWWDNVMGACDMKLRNWACVYYAGCEVK